MFGEAVKLTVNALSDNVSYFGLYSSSQEDILAEVDFKKEWKFEKSAMTISFTNLLNAAIPVLLQWLVLSLTDSFYDCFYWQH